MLPATDTGVSAEIIPVPLADIVKSPLFTMVENVEDEKLKLPIVVSEGNVVTPTLPTYL